MKFRADEKTFDYLENWIVEQDLHCTPKTWIGLIGSLTFLATAVGALTAPPLGDKYGKRTIVLIFQIIAMLGFLFLFFSKSIGVTLAATFCIGLYQGNRVTLGYCFMIDFVPMK